MDQDRPQHKVFGSVRGEQPRPDEKPKLHDGVEAHAPGLRVDFGDRRKLLGVMIEGVGIYAEERAPHSSEAIETGPATTAATAPSSMESDAARGCRSVGDLARSLIHCPSRSNDMAWSASSSCVLFAFPAVASASSCHGSLFGFACGLPVPGQKFVKLSGRDGSSPDPGAAGRRHTHPARHGVFVRRRRST